MQLYENIHYIPRNSGFIMNINDIISQASYDSQLIIICPVACNVNGPCMPPSSLPFRHHPLPHHVYRAAPGPLTTYPRPTTPMERPCTPTPPIPAPPPHLYSISVSMVVRQCRNLQVLSSL